MQKALFLAASLGLLACGRKQPPVELAPFRSVFGDFECLAPKNWEVETSEDAQAYRFTVWLGPDDPRSLWGRPRFVLAWHAAGKPFRKASGEPGRYESADDYLRQMLQNVWGPDPKYPEPRHPVTVDGRSAERLTVRVRKDAYMALPEAKPVSQGGGRMWRRDIALLVPTRSGFYAIVFPAAEATYARYAPAFERLVESLRFLKESPVEGTRPPAGGE